MSLVKAEEIVRDMITTDKYFKLEYDSAQTIKGLTKIPVMSNYVFQDVPEYKLFQELQKEGSVKVKETGVVKSLEILNQSQYPVFIPSGSLFVSQEYGRQDRCAVTDIIVEKNGKTEIPVVCVEKNRWSGRSRSEVDRIVGSKRIDNSDFINYGLSPSKVFYATQSSATKNYMDDLRSSPGVQTLGSRRRVRASADQGLVWGKVDEEIQQANAKNPTSSLTEVNMKKEKEGKLEFNIYENEIGNIFFGNDKVLSMEVYQSPSKWQIMAKDTIKRYKTNVTKEEAPKRELIDKFLSDLSKCKPVAVESTGLGYDVRLTEGKVDGSCLVFNETPIHLTAMPKNENVKNYGDGIHTMNLTVPYGSRPNVVLRDSEESRMERQELWETLNRMHRGKRMGGFGDGTSYYVRKDYTLTPRNRRGF